MRLNKYQELAGQFAQYHHHDYPFLALAEETGEVMGKLAKYVRKNNTTLNNAIYQAKTPLDEKSEVLYHDLVLELGDVAWQLQECCTALGVTLEEVCRANLQKLTDRKARNVIVGEGDSR